MNPTTYSNPATIEKSILGDLLIVSRPTLSACWLGDRWQVKYGSREVADIRLTIEWHLKKHQPDLVAIQFNNDTVALLDPQQLLATEEAYEGNYYVPVTLLKPPIK